MSRFHSHRRLPALFIFITFLASSVVFGEPRVRSVDGPISEGGQVELKGDGFGEKPSARPVLWADFEKNIQPSKGGERRKWDDIENMAWSQEGPDGSGCAKAADSSGVWTMRVDKDYWSKEGEKMYIFRREKMNFVISNPNTQNWKIWRMWPKDQRYPNIYIGANGLVDVENVGGKGGFYGRCYVPSFDWVSSEIFFQASSMNVKNGIVWVRCNGVDLTRGEVLTRSTKGNAYMSKNYAVHAVAANRSRWSPPWVPTNRYWVDEVYVDTSWARVMLGDRPLRKEGRKWELQIPVKWTDSAIEFESHAGVFRPGETAYLFVFDSENRANEVGFPVRIGDNRPALARVSTENQETE